jgi:DNA-binding MarR family transcriptional regulator
MHMGRDVYPGAPRADGSGAGGDGSIPLPRELRFLRLIWAVCHELESHSKRTERRHGITMPQRLVLRLIGHGDDPTSGHLAAALHLHPSTLTGILQRLERRGLVERRGHPEDGRRRVFRLTATGRRLDRGEHELETLVGAALSRLRSADHDAARRVLEHLAEEFARGRSG